MQQHFPTERKSFFLLAFAVGGQFGITLEANSMSFGLRHTEALANYSGSYVTTLPVAH
jgi:hypothetical protein